MWKERRAARGRRSAAPATASAPPSEMTARCAPTMVADRSHAADERRAAAIRRVPSKSAPPRSRRPGSVHSSAPTPRRRRADRLARARFASATHQCEHRVEGAAAPRRVVVGIAAEQDRPAPASPQRGFAIATSAAGAGALSRLPGSRGCRARAHHARAPAAPPLCSRADLRTPVARRRQERQRDARRGDQPAPSRPRCGHDVFFFFFLIGKSARAGSPSRSGARSAGRTRRGRRRGTSSPSSPAAVQVGTRHAAGVESDDTALGDATRFVVRAELDRGSWARLRAGRPRARSSSRSVTERALRARAVGVRSITPERARTEALAAAVAESAARSRCRTSVRISAPSEASMQPAWLQCCRRGHEKPLRDRTPLDRGAEVGARMLGRRARGARSTRKPARVVYGPRQRAASRCPLRGRSLLARTRTPKRLASRCTVVVW